MRPGAAEWRSRRRGRLPGERPRSRVRRRPLRRHRRPVRRRHPPPRGGGCARRSTTAGCEQGCWSTSRRSLTSSSRSASVPAADDEAPTPGSTSNVSSDWRTTRSRRESTPDRRMRLRSVPPATRSSRRSPSSTSGRPSSWWTPSPSVSAAPGRDCPGCRGFPSRTLLARDEELYDEMLRPFDQVLVRPSADDSRTQVAMAARDSRGLELGVLLAPDRLRPGGARPTCGCHSERPNRRGPPGRGGDRRRRDRCLQLRTAPRRGRPTARATGATGSRDEGERMKLEHRVALIFGGASGIGRGSAEAMAAEGAAVLVADVNEEGGAEVVAGIESRGGRARLRRRPTSPTRTRSLGPCRRPSTTSGLSTRW